MSDIIDIIDSYDIQDIIECQVILTTCADATAVLKNTAGTTLSTTSIPSGDSEDITAPDATVNVQDQNSNPLGTITAPSGATSTRQVTVTCPTLDDLVDSSTVNQVVSAIQSANKECGVLSGLETEYAPITNTGVPYACKWNPVNSEYYVVDVNVGVKIFNEDKTLNRGFANAGVFSFAFNEDYSMYGLLEIGTTTIYNTSDDTVAGTIGAGFGGVAFKNGNVYVDNGLTSVFEYTIAGTLVDTISLVGTGLSRIRSMKTDYTNNRLYVGGDNGNGTTGGRLCYIDMTTHAVTAISIPTMGSVSSIELDSSDNLWITVDTNSNLIYNLQNDGTLIESYPYIYRDSNSRQTIGIREDMSCDLVLLIPNPHSNVDRVEFFRP